MTSPPPLRGRIPGVMLVAALAGVALAGARGQEVRAVSLSRLQEALEPSAPPTDPPGVASADVSHFGGLTRLDGFIVDAVGRDVIAFGVRERNAPLLQTDDVIVALRNAWRMYARSEGGTVHYASPGCSLEPDSANLAAMQRLAEQARAAGDANERERLGDAWTAECRQPQRAEIWGVPRSTRFARVMLDADYELKAIADGSQKLAIPDMLSLPDTTRRAIEANAGRGVPGGPSTTQVRRFWFELGDLETVSDGQATALRRCPVRLLTEEQHLSREGITTGARQADSLAAWFCARFTESFGEIAVQRPVFADLEQLFRCAALSALMRRQDCFARAGLDPQGLLERYQPAQVTTPETMPGRASVVEFTVQRALEGTPGTARYWLRSCGGVSMAVNLDDAAAHPDSAGQLARLREAILANRPADGAVSWSIGTPDDSLDGRR